jgi:hypothetical protein
MKMSSVLAPNILIATPTYGDMLTVPYVNAAFEMLLTLQRLGIAHTFQFLSCSNIVEGRNTLISMFLADKQYTHILFWDADMGVKAESLIKLIKADKPLCGLVYHKKNLDWAKIKTNAANVRSNIDFLSSSLEFIVRFPGQIDGGPVDVRVENGLTQVETLGTGFLLIRRDCAETMMNKFPNLLYRTRTGFRTELPHYALFNCIIDETERRFYSEDYSFCLRWTRECGGAIFALVDATVVHAGQMALTANYMEKLKSGTP